MCWEDMKGTLILEDGSEFTGRLFGATSKANLAGEIGLYLKTIISLSLFY